MHKATILFNPNSGRPKRDAELNHAIGVIQSAGVRTELTVCRSSQEATDNARCAVADGSDTVFACGGDGTIHDVIQGLAGTPVALAILPFGTANALAHDLGIPMRPSAAAQVAVGGKFVALLSGAWSTRPSAARLRLATLRWLRALAWTRTFSTT